MAEEDLINRYYTHPKDMDGASRLSQHDRIYKQMSTYEKLIQHAMNRFSTEKLYQMLKMASEGIPKVPKVPRQSSKSEHGTEIRSLADLQEVIEGIEQNKHQRGIEKEEEAHLVKYFEGFFEDMKYFQDLKKHFDEKIYVCLYDYFYDPTDDLDEYRPEIMTDRSKGQKSAHEVKPNERSNVALDDLNDKEKLSYAVKEMYVVNHAWDKLFTYDGINPKYFDPDSQYELTQFQDYENYEELLRLVPDLFVKAYKSAELAKLWWTQANKTYKDLPGKRASGKEFHNKVEVLENQVVTLADEISNEEELLDLQFEDLKVLKAREDRFNKLADTCEKVEQLKNKVGERYNAIVLEKERLEKELSVAMRGTSEFITMEYELKKCNQRTIEASGELKVLTYHFDLLQQDFNLEMQFRSDIIRFVTHVEERIEMLAESVRSKHTTRRDIEKQLILMRTNHDRMKTIVRKHLDSPNHERKPICKSKREDETLSDDSETTNERKRYRDSIEKEPYSPRSDDREYTNDENMSERENCDESELEDSQPSPSLDRYQDPYRNPKNKGQDPRQKPKHSRHKGVDRTISNRTYNVQSDEDRNSLDGNSGNSEGSESPKPHNHKKKSRPRNKSQPAYDSGYEMSAEQEKKNDSKSKKNGVKRQSNPKHWRNTSCT